MAGVRESSTYRLALLGGLVANIAFGLLKYGILTETVEQAGGAVAGYDAVTMSGYIWLSQGLLGSVNLFGRTTLGERIHSGDVVVDFLRPLPLQASTCLREVGRSLFALLPRGVPSVAIGALLVGVSLPTTVPGWIVSATSVLLAIGVSAASIYLVGVTGFWLVETRGVRVLYMIVSGFLAGLFVPIHLLPAALRGVAWCTPFPSMLMLPVDVASSRLTGTAAVAAVATQAAWLIGTVAVGALATGAGRRRLEVQGG